MTLALAIFFCAIFTIFFLLCTRFPSFYWYFCFLSCAFPNQVDCNGLSFMYDENLMKKINRPDRYSWTVIWNRLFIYLFFLATFGQRFNEIQFDDNLWHCAYILKSPHSTDYICCVNCTPFFSWCMKSHALLWKMTLRIKSKYSLLEYVHQTFFLLLLFALSHKPKLCNSSIQSSHDNISFKQISQPFSLLSLSSFPP